MSRANVETTRRWIDAWNRADIDTFSNFFDDEAEVVTDPSWPESGSFNGRDAIREWYESLREIWAESGHIVITDLVAAGDTEVARLHWRVRGRTSGIDADLDITCINTVERDKIARQRWYFDHSAALEAAGLTE